MSEKPAFLTAPNFLRLREHYCDYPIALYTGAGVSYSSNKDYGMRGWDELLRQVVVLSEESVPGIVAEFDSLVEGGGTEKPWDMAEWVLGKIKEDEFKDKIRILVQREKNFQKKYKLLSGEYLKAAPTLEATAAFCASLAGGRHKKGKDGKVSTIYTVIPNRRVQAVVTSNYDPFLEAGSSTMYRRLLKPVSAVGSDAGDLRHIPVYHVHGYVNFPKFSNGEEVKTAIPLIDPVITKSDYKKAWRADDAYNVTMAPQIYILRHYSVLFIGFSFRDKWVIKLMKKLNQEREDSYQNKIKSIQESGKRTRKKIKRLYHYALMREGEENDRGKDFFDEIGVLPIALEGFDQIPIALSEIYQAGLVKDHGEEDILLPLTEHQTEKNDPDMIRPVVLSPGEYFEDLQRCRVGKVWRRKDEDNLFFRTRVEGIIFSRLS